MALFGMFGENRSRNNGQGHETSGGNGRGLESNRSKLSKLFHREKTQTIELQSLIEQIMLDEQLYLEFFARLDLLTQEISQLKDKFSKLDDIKGQTCELYTSCDGEGDCVREKNIQVNLNNIQLSIFRQIAETQLPKISILIADLYASIRPIKCCQPELDELAALPKTLQRGSFLSDEQLDDNYVLAQELISRAKDKLHGLMSQALQVIEKKAAENIDGIVIYEYLDTLGIQPRVFPPEQAWQKARQERFFNDCLDFQFAFQTMIELVPERNRESFIRMLSTADWRALCDLDDINQSQALQVRDVQSFLTDFEILFKTSSDNENLVFLDDEGQNVTSEIVELAEVLSSIINSDQVPNLITNQDKLIETLLHFFNKLMNLKITKNSPEHDSNFVEMGRLIRRLPHESGRIHNNLFNWSSQFEEVKKNYGLLIKMLFPGILPRIAIIRDQILDYLPPSHNLRLHSVAVQDNLVLMKLLNIARQAERNNINVWRQNLHTDVEKVQQQLYAEPIA